MEWIGLVSFVFLIFYVGYPKRVNILERKVKRLERQVGGVNEMSRMIMELIGKKCKIQPADWEVFASTTERIFEIVDVDEEWVKVRHEVKKTGKVTKLIRMEDIKSIEEVIE